MRTFRSYDSVLKWVPGSAHAIYRDGASPAILDDFAEPIMDLAELEQLREGLRSVGVKLRSGDDDGATSEVAALTGQVDDAIRRATAEQVAAERREQSEFLTDILERTREMAGPMVEPFGHLMDIDEVSVGSDEYVNVLYRRWLIGESDALPAAQLAAFEQRLRDAEGRQAEKLARTKAAK